MIKSIFKYKLSRAWFITSVALLVLAVTVSIVLTQNGFLYNTISSVFGGEERVLVSGDPSEYMYYTGEYKDKASVLEAANALNEKIAEEGVVLLKNEGKALPVKTPVSDSSVTAKPRISVFGKNSVNLVYGGSGSGEASTDGAVTLYESLSAAGYEVNPTLKSFYESSESGNGRPKSPSMGSLLAGYETGETPQSKYTDAVRESYAEYNDAALIVISRIGGEGYDLPRTMKTGYGEGAEKISGARDAEDHYLQLDENETELIKEVSESFEKIIVIINSATPIELGFLDDESHYAYSEKIKAALWIGSLGKTGVNAVGRILNGEVNPSGRTVDTYARDFKKDPTWANFGNNNKTDGNRYFVEGKKRAYYYVEYEEGIYVGYRYYETRGYEEAQKGNVAWYDENVVYPLGYGLSYTDFSYEITNKAEISALTSLGAKGVIDVDVKVTNTGDVSGKTAVQIYATAPYNPEGEERAIEKSHKVLVGFEKTGEIAAKDEEEITVSVPAYYLASYDWDDANGNEFIGYEIERGEYTLGVGENAHTNADEVSFTLTGGLEMSEDPVTGEEVTNRFDDVSEYISKYMSRQDFEGTFPTAPTEEELNVEQSFIDSLKYEANDAGKKWEVKEAPSQSKKELSYNATKVKLYDLIGKEYDDPKWDELLNQLTVKQMVELVGSGNYKTIHITNIAKPKTIDPDGPVGFTAFMGDPSVYDTCFYASGCVVGATYNVELAYAMGEMVGNEGLIGNERGDGTPYSGWYAPAVNIHRSPFSGRNWEYYSEDGYLSGMIASGVIRGAKSKGVYTYVKHFALNDQETNRSTNGVLTWANEQSMREIYFRPFELAVKEGETTAMMSSFNRIGKTWAGGSYELLTEVLRDEWGFKGMVVTDYNYATPYMDVDQMIRAGGDLNLGAGNMPSDSNDATQVAQLRRAMKNILYTVAGSNAMNGLGEGVVYRYNMPRWVIYCILFDVCVILLLVVWGFISVKRSLRRNEKD